MGRRSASLGRTYPFFSREQSARPDQGDLRAAAIVDLNDARPSEHWEFAVLIPVGKVSKRRRPVASPIWLEPLEGCDMAGLDALTPGVLFPSPELIWRVYDRELRKFLGRSGIEFAISKTRYSRAVRKL
jgi:hypothetical protein